MVDFVYMRDLTYSIPRNLALMTAGSALIAFAVKAVALPHGFVSGGASGLALLSYYVSDALSPGVWYFLVNVPMFVIGYLGVSRRFFLYSIFGMAVSSLFIDLIQYTAPIQDHWLAVLAAGTIFGAGAGIALRSLGSTGGLDMVSVTLNHKFNIPIGKVSFTFNLVLLTTSMFFLSVDRALYSLAMVFIAAQVVEYFLKLFNRRKMVIVISNRNEEIAEAILKKMGRGATFLSGRGAYTGEPREVLFTVINDIELRRLERIVYGIDKNAFTIIENTFNVIGYRFSKLKVY
jgi:uncharacterized membrane-anchored protein YitT (DUF2179 family)